jgi:hypothetical protein
MNMILFLFLILTYLIIVICNNYHENELFTEINYGPYHNKFTPYKYSHYRIPFYNDYTDFPFWNTQIGNKRYMSHDLRGEPIIIPRNYFPWNNSSIYPIYNRPLIL